MPRRNTTKRRTRQIPAGQPATPPPPSYSQMARSLVERGLRTHVILEVRGPNLSTIDATSNQKGN